MDDVKTEAIDLLKKIIWCCQAKATEEYRGPSQVRGFAPPAAPAPWMDLEKKFDALETVLRIPDGEREFIQAIAQRLIEHELAAVYDVLAVFADWLEEHEHPQAERYRKLTLQEGDVLLFYAKDGIAADNAREVVAALKTHAAKVGREVLALLTRTDKPAHLKFEAQYVPAKSLREAGWERRGEGEDRGAKKERERILQELLPLQGTSSAIDAVIADLRERKASHSGRQKSKVKVAGTVDVGTPPAKA